MLRESNESRRSSGSRRGGARRATRLALLLAAAPLLAACGQQSEPASPPPAAAPEAAAPQASVQQISADARSCLDLVGQKRYADAIDPCERAVKQGASADVEKALAEARAAVKSEAQAAATKTAVGTLQGQSPEEAAKKSASDALRNLGGSQEQPQTQP